MSESTARPAGDGRAIRRDRGPGGHFIDVALRPGQLELSKWPLRYYCGHMRVIGIRELKETLSATLHSVGRGEHVRVTSRGRPVADIVPAGAAAADDRMRRLVADGRLVPAARSRPRRAPKLVKADRRASALVLAEREAER